MEVDAGQWPTAGNLIVLSGQGLQREGDKPYKPEEDYDQRKWRGESQKRNVCRG